MPLFRCLLLILNIISFVFGGLHNYDNSQLYDNGGLHGYPNQTFRTSEWVAPRFNVLKHNPAPLRNLFTLITLRGYDMRDMGPMIFDASHHLVWFLPGMRGSHNLKMQEYNDEKHLTFWTGNDGYGRPSKGMYRILDSSYEEVLTIPAPSMFSPESTDQHECLITKNGTAVYATYERYKISLSSIDGSLEKGFVWDCHFQEIDLKSRKILFRWRASDVVPLSHSTKEFIRDIAGSYQSPWDWFHLNSIDKDDDGNYLISARHTNSLYCISGKDGSIVWILGGSANQFRDLSDGRATNFALQHDAKWHGPNQISLFDNGSNAAQNKRTPRGVLLEIDVKNNPPTARLLQEYLHPDYSSAVSPGSMQMLSGTESVLLGWGRVPSWTEFDRNGSVIEDVRLGPSKQFAGGNIESYSAYKAAWRGFPKTRPILVICGSAAYVSWNGATEVHHWMLQGINSKWFPKSNNWVDVVVEERQGFETILNFEPDHMKKYIRVVAFSADGEVLGLTKTVDWRFAEKPFAKSLHLSDLDSLLFPLVPCLLVLVVLFRILKRCARRGYVPSSVTRQRDKGAFEM